jgi:hypothetical protein
MSLEYTDLVKAVFSNRHGEELMDAWQEMYGDQVSFIEGVSSEGVAHNEGYRAFYLTLKSILKNG